MTADFAVLQQHKKGADVWANSVEKYIEFFYKKNVWMKKKK
jgi:hypothetical protein